MAEMMSKILTERGAADYLGLSVRTLQKFRFERKDPPYHKFGRCIRYHMDDLEAYMTRHRIDPSKAA